MNIYIENEYDKEMKERLDYEKLIEEVVNEAVDYVKCPYECEVNVTIVTNERIHEINNEFRGIDKETDVLSFPMIDYDKPGDFTGFDEIDDYFDEIRDQIIQLIREGDGRDGRKLFDFIMVTKYLERIGDHATNIAEWVEFAITGVHKDSAVMH